MKWIHNKYIEKPKIKRLKSIDLLSKLPFNAKLDVIDTGRAFKGLGISYKVELVGKKVLLIQLDSSKSNIKYIKSRRSLDLLDETKRFKYQITLRVKKIQAKRENWVFYCLFQLNNGSNDTS